MSMQFTTRKDSRTRPFEPSNLFRRSTLFPSSKWIGVLAVVGQLLGQDSNLDTRHLKDILGAEAPLQRSNRAAHDNASRHGQLSGPYLPTNRASLEGDTDLVLYLNPFSVTPDLASKHAQELATRIGKPTFLLLSTAVPFSNEQAPYDSSKSRVRAALSREANAFNQLGTNLVDGLGRLSAAKKNVLLVTAGSSSVITRAAIRHFARTLEPLSAEDRERAMKRIRVLELSIGAASDFPDANAPGVIAPTHLGGFFRLRAPIFDISAIIPSINESHLKSSGDEFLFTPTEVHEAPKTSQFADAAQKILHRVEYARASQQLESELSWLETERVLRTDIAPLRKGLADFRREISRLHSPLSKIAVLQRTNDARIQLLHASLTNLSSEIKDFTRMQEQNSIRFGSLRKDVEITATFFSEMIAAGELVKFEDLDDGEITEPIGALVCEEFSELLYINGRNTESYEAAIEARAVAKKLGCAVRLVFNDLTFDPSDLIAAGWDKLLDADFSLNAATETLVTRIKNAVSGGREIHLIGYSGGTIVLMNAVNKVAEVYGDLTATERAARLSRIHVLLVGQAVYSQDQNFFADGWPSGIGSVHELYRRRDGIAQWFGPEDIDEPSLAAHKFLERYVPVINAEMLRKSGRTRLE